MLNMCAHYEAAVSNFSRGEKTHDDIGDGR